MWCSCYFQGYWYQCESLLFSLSSWNFFGELVLTDIVFHTFLYPYFFWRSQCLYIGGNNVSYFFKDVFTFCNCIFYCFLQITHSVFPQVCCFSLWQLKNRCTFHPNYRTWKSEVAITSFPKSICLLASLLASDCALTIENIL